LKAIYLAYKTVSYSLFAYLYTLYCVQKDWWNEEQNLFTAFILYSNNKTTAHSSCVWSYHFVSKYRL